MNCILDFAHRAVLAPFLAEGTLLVLGYRGILVPDGDRVAEAALPRATRDLLDLVTRRYRVAILAGTDRKGALRQLQGPGTFEVLGDDDIGVNATDPVCALQTIGDWKNELEERLEGFSGLQVRDRLFSIVVDFRATHSPRLAERAVRRVASQLENARLSEAGNGVMEIELPAASDQTSALRHLAARAERISTLFVHGDCDPGDQFGLVPSSHFLPICVGDDRCSTGYCLRDRTEVDALLRVLAEGAVSTSRRRRASAT